MSKPIVAIVGRPNVGKSTLFNRLTGNRIAIVEGEPSVTRDRIYADITWLGNSFILVDTGGIEPRNKDTIKEKIKYQSQLAIEEADIILFVVDGKEGLNSIDQEVAQMLRKTNKEVILVINKADDYQESEEMIWEFFALGFGRGITISSEHGKNTGDLLDLVIEKLPDKKEELPEDDSVMDIAIIGKPNVGKSSLVNFIAGKDRVIVSDIPGTTRDAVDTLVQFEDSRFNLIDTAGLRRKSKINESVEYYSSIRSIRAIDRADGVLMMIDATQGVTEQDKKIAGYAHDEGKAIVIAINKWDLIDKDLNTMERYRDEVYYQMKFLMYAPVTFISAITGERVEEVLKLLEFSIDQNNRRIKTGVLNEVLQEALQLREPPSKKGKRLKIYYATQVGVKPPTFVFYVNNPQLMHFAYLRYLDNTLRKSFGFIGTPLKIKLKQRT